MARWVVLLLCMTATVGRAQTTAKAPSAISQPLRILFIGNEYTSANGGLNAVLQAMAKSRGHAAECVASTASGKSLQWHWESGGARQLITKGKWDYVVLQPSAVESTAEAIKLLNLITS